MGQALAFWRRNCGNTTRNSQRAHHKAGWCPAALGRRGAWSCRGSLGVGIQKPVSSRQGEPRQGSRAEAPGAHEQTVCLYVWVWAWVWAFGAHRRRCVNARKRESVICLFSSVLRSASRRKLQAGASGEVPRRIPTFGEHRAAQVPRPDVGRRRGNRCSAAVRVGLRQLRADTSGDSGHGSLSAARRFGLHFFGKAHLDTEAEPQSPPRSPIIA